MNTADPLALAATALQRGQPVETLRLVDAILARQPNHPAALGLKANAALLTGEFDHAVDALQRLVALQPDQPALRRVLSQTLNRAGSAARQAQREGDAEQAFAQALGHWPDNREALFNLALCYMQSRRHALALPLWQHLLVLAPDDVEAGIELSIALALSGRFGEALDTLARTELPPDATTTLRLRRIEALLFGGDVEAAGAALARCPDRNDDAWPATLSKLAEQFAHAGAVEQARSLYRRAAGARGNGAIAPGLRDLIAAHLAIPAIVASADTIQRVRHDFARGLDQLHRSLDDDTVSACAPGLAQLAWSNFFLAYQGEDDHAPQSSYGDLLARLAPSFAPALPAPAVVRNAGRPARIGLVSSCFRECTAGAYFGSWPRLLADSGHDVQVFQLGPHFDAATDAIGGPPATLHRVEGRADELAVTLAESGCDLLIYPELGMDARLLPVAALRLAPRQACAWGHPVTSGLPTIDAYFSCADMEPDDAPTHYRERLLLLPGLGTDYRQPIAPPPASRADLGLPELARLYLLPHSLFKLHPDNDALFATIAATDPDGVLVLFQGEGAAMRPPFQARLAAALRAAGADPDRQLLFLPMTSRERFLQINRACDVMVDSLHWSGGNTSIDALISGLPVITRAGRTMRARQSAAMLRRLGLDELIATDPMDLAARAVATARDPRRRETLSRRIQSGLPRLFDSGGVREALDTQVRALLAGLPAQR